MPHVAIVTNTERFDETGTFQCIEAQTGSGLPRGITDADGVFLRVRNDNDVLIYARPDFAPTSRKSFSHRLNVATYQLQGQEPELLNPAQLTSGRPNRATEIVQLALVQRVGLKTYKPGTIDAATRSAIARFQRAIGRVGPDAAGNLETYTLARLAADTGLFRVPEADSNETDRPSS
jgi:hypothetical protein